jgi:hypothetical protein
LGTRKIEKERVAVIYLAMNERHVSIVLAAVESSVLLIRRRLRINKEQDLETAEI